MIQGRNVFASILTSIWSVAPPPVMEVTFLLQSKYQKIQLGPPVNNVTLFRLGAHTALPSLNLQRTLNMQYDILMIHKL